MADESIEIEVVAKTNDEEVISLQGLIEELKGTEINIKAVIDNSELDILKDDLKDIDGSKIETEFKIDDDELEDLKDNIKDIDNTSIDIGINVDDSEIDDAKDKLDEISDIDTTITVDDKELDDAKNKKDEIEKDAEVKVNVDSSGLDALETGLAGVVSLGIAELGEEMMNTAGRISDSWNRLELTFGQVTESMKSDISATSTATGRSGAIVRNFFNQMGIAGVKNTKLIGKSFESLSGFAYQSGQDIETMIGKMQKMVMTGTVSNRMLASMGLSTEKLGQAMGVTADEVKNVFSSMSNEERMNALVKAMGDGTKANEMYKESWEGVKEKASAEFAGLMGAIGTPILQFMIPIMQQLTQIVTTITSAFKKLPAPIQTAIGGILAGAIGLTTFAGMIPAFTKAIDGLKSGFGTLSNIAGKLPVVGSKFAIFGKETESVIDTANKTGKLGSKGAKAGSGMKATSVSLKSIGQGAMSMLAPLIEISIVIAVMIPIITALVIEALLFVKLIQLVIDALGFDKVDLSGAIKGIKQIAKALFEIGVAMATMTFVNIMSQITLITGGIMGLISPLAIAKHYLLTASNELKAFANVDINDKIPSNIRKISESLKATGEALKNLTEVIGVTAWAGFIAWVGGLGTVTNAIKTAGDELKEAIGIINSMEIQSIDEEKAKKLETVSKALKNFGDAMSGIGDITWTDFMNNINPFTNVITALRNSKQDIIEASKVINEFDGISDINEGTASKLSKVTEALKNIGEALGKMSDIDWEVNMKGFNPFKQLVPSLRTAKGDIVEGSKVLASLDAEISNIPDGVGDKIKKVGSVATNVIDNLKVLNNVDAQVTGAGFGNPMKNIVESIRTAKNDINQSATILASLNNISEVPDGTGDKIKKVGSTATTVIDSIKALNNIEGVAFESTSLITTFEQAKTSLIQIATKLKALETIEEIPSTVVERVNAVSSTSRTTIDAIKQLAVIQGVTVDYTVLETTFEQAKTSLINIGHKLSELATMTEMPTGIGEKLNMMSTVIQAVGRVLTSLSTIPIVVIDEAIVKLGISTIRNIITELNTLSSMNIDGGIENLLNIVTNTLNSMKATLSTMAGGFTSVSIGIGSSIVNGIKTGLAPLNGTVRSSLSSAINSAIGTASNGGRNLGTNVVNGFRSTLKLGTVMSTEMSNVVRATQNGVNQAKQVAQQGGHEIVQAFKSGLETGSPGEMYWTMVGEYGYIQNMMKGSIGTFSDLSEKVGTNIVGSFGVDGQKGLSSSVASVPAIINNGSNVPPTINIYVDGDINDEKTMDKLVDRLTRAISWSNATGNRTI